MTSAAETDEPLTIDDLARRVQLPVRTIREYHTMRLLPPPERRGRLGLYGDQHIQRLRLIIRLQRRGYSLAGIRDLLAAWESGTDLVTVLGVDESQAALDETPLFLTRAELFQRLPELESGTSSHTKRRQAESRECLLSSRSRVRVAVGAQVMDIFRFYIHMRWAVWGA